MAKRRTLGKRRRRNPQYTRTKNKRKYFRKMRGGNNYETTELINYLNSRHISTWRVDDIQQYMDDGALIHAVMPPIVKGTRGMAISAYIRSMQGDLPKTENFSEFLKNLPDTLHRSPGHTSLPLYTQSRS